MNFSYQTQMKPQRDAMKVYKKIKNMIFLIFFSSTFMFSAPVPADEHVVYVNHGNNQKQKKVITQSKLDKQLRFKIEKEKKYFEKKQRLEMSKRVMEDGEISSINTDIALVSGTLNDQADTWGYFELLGEVKNNGSTAATYAEVTIKLYNSSNVLIDTAYTYIRGGTIVKVGTWYTNALLPGETGFFSSSTWTSYSDVDHYTYSFRSGSLYSSLANASLSFAHSPTVRDNYGYLVITGEVTNTSSSYMTYYSGVYFAIYNASGKVIAVERAYIDGPDANGVTHTIQPGATESFELYTWASYSSYSSYKYAFEFEEMLATPSSEPTIAINTSYLAFGSDSNEQSFTISNSGTGTLNWTVAENVGWMSCTPTSGTNSGTVVVTIDRSGLSPGLYTETIIVSDPNATNHGTVSISMEVAESGEGNPQIQVNRDELYFGSIDSISTSAQTLLVSNSGTGTLNWAATENASWMSCTPSSGTDSGIITVSVNGTGLAAGTYTENITLTDANDTNLSETVSVTLKVYGSTSEPFGQYATPISGSTVSSSVPVTGWVLDDIGVENVKLFRGNVGSLIYIGDAVFVEGARPDVEAAYQGTPQNYKAGWGYMMLTNFLPGGGNGTFNIHAIATDMEGHQVTLGTKTITVDNANAVKPFGAIDTPGQGGTASGSSFINWGWVLTPQPNSIPTDGSTINVYVDSVNLGHPNYNIYREDIANLFPTYANSNGAIGYFYLDTTSYSNGVHTIQWSAADSAGNSDGIGSRYFTVQNTGAGSDKTAQSNSCRFNSQQIADIPVKYNSPLIFRQGIDKNKHISIKDEKGISILKIKELELIELQLAGNETFVSAYLLSGDQRQPLPIGSTLKSGTFSWIPGPGFINNYKIMFLVKNRQGVLSKREVVIRVEPRFGANTKQE